MYNACLRLGGKTLSFFAAVKELTPMAITHNTGQVPHEVALFTTRVRYRRFRLARVGERTLDMVGYLFFLF